MFYALKAKRMELVMLFQSMLHLMIGIYACYLLGSKTMYRNMLQGYFLAKLLKTLIAGMSLLCSKEQCTMR